VNRIDHVALVVDNPREATDWYISKFGAELLYVDDSWGLVQFENIKLAFVIKSQHPPHIAFEDVSLEVGKQHRDGSKSIYKKDPFGNFYELIKYKEKE
jgi:catechol 2,3-dioxygenase-like lactoylglutathione lyase family enzyme